MFRAGNKKGAKAPFFCNRMSKTGSALDYANGVSNPTIWPKIFGLAAMMSPLYR